MKDIDFEILCSEGINLQFVDAGLVGGITCIAARHLHLVEFGDGTDLHGADFFTALRAKCNQTFAVTEVVFNQSLSIRIAIFGSERITHGVAACDNVCHANDYAG